MWISSCPRCSHAVRWNLRGAREPFRMWQRWRAVNGRMGFTLSGAVGAGIFGFVTGAMSLENAGRWSGQGVTMSLAPIWLAIKDGTIVPILLCAMLATECALAVAPHRSIFARFAFAWLVLILPVIAGMCAVVNAVDPENFRRDFERAFALTPSGTLRLFCVPIVLSAILTAVGVPVMRAVERVRVTIFRTKFRESNRGLAHGAAQQRTLEASRTPLPELP